MKQSSSSDDESSNSLCRSDFLAAMKVKSGPACGCLSGVWWPVLVVKDQRARGNANQDITANKIVFRFRTGNNEISNWFQGQEVAKINPIHHCNRISPHLQSLKVLLGPVDARRCRSAANWWPRRDWRWVRF
jgi:hypothetical protein